MEILFRRNTHNIDGSFREELRSKEQCYNEAISGLGVHALSSDKKMSLGEFVEEHYSYEQHYPDTRTPPINALLRDLAILIELGMVNVYVE